MRMDETRQRRGAARLAHVAHRIPQPNGLLLHRNRLTGLLKACEPPVDGPLHRKLTMGIESGAWTFGVWFAWAGRDRPRPP